MKILSISQPWAWLVFNDSHSGLGLKDCENKLTYENISYRGELCICTFSKKHFDYKGYEKLIKSGHQIPLPDSDEYSYGAIIGVVELADVVTDVEISKWRNKNTIGYMFKNPRKLKEPFKFSANRVIKTLLASQIKTINDLIEQ